jgi:predicted nucleic-acid-binding Zn-ribbon protein
MYWSTCPKGKLKQATNGNWNNSTSQIAIQLTGTLLYTVIDVQRNSIMERFRRRL